MPCSQRRHVTLSCTEACLEDDLGAKSLFLSSPTADIMASFVASPQFLTSLVTRPYLPFSQSSHKNSHPYQRRHCCPVSRMRHREGFQLPPHVPSDERQRARAVELLGACTQKKITRKSTVNELEQLVGGFPPNRLIAQQWKGAMQRDMARAKNRRDVNAFKNRIALTNKLTLSEKNGIVSRCFILLEVARKRYNLDQAPNPIVLRELKSKLGSYPKCALDARRHIQALARIQRDRALMEKRPPRIPVDDFAQMYEASMLLGLYAVRGSAGKQNHRLEALIGTIPRNENIAGSWQKRVKLAIREKKESERSALKRREIECKRTERRLRRIKREQKGNLQTLSDSMIPEHDSNDVIQGSVAASTADSAVVSDTIRTGQRREEKKTWLSRVVKKISSWLSFSRITN